MPFPDSFSKIRLQTERLTSDHLSEVLRMHRDPAVMAHLGGVRDDDQTAAYLARNLQHWADYGFGLWILRERGGGEPIGRVVLRHLFVEGVDEVEVHLGTIVAVTSPTNLASQRVLEKVGLVYEREFIHEGALSALFRARASSTEGPLWD